MTLISSQQKKQMEKKVPFCWTVMKGREHQNSDLARRATVI